MKLPFFACQLALIATLHAEKPVPAKGLFDQLISHPGSYAQVCDVMEVPADVPFRAFSLTDFAGAGFSKANEALMKLNRNGLIKSARARLADVDLTREGIQPAVDPKPEENQDGDAYGCDPKTLNPLTLGLLQQLKAIEALPELLMLEDKLVSLIAKAKDDNKAPAPIVYGWLIGGSGADESWDEQKRERFNRLFQARVAQRDLVMLIAGLLREEKSPAYLATSFEKAYVKGLTANAKAAGLLELHEGDVIPAEMNGRQIEVDPVTDLFRFANEPILIPYSREFRDEIRAAAVKWLAEHP